MGEILISVIELNQVTSKKKKDRCKINKSHKLNKFKYIKEINFFKQNKYNKTKNI